MQELNFHKFLKQILCILILFIIINVAVNFTEILQNKSYAATYTYTNASNNLPENFDELYPQYRTLINTLTTNHPNWTFMLYETGLDWNAVIDAESKHGKNLIDEGYCTSTWKCQCNTAYDGIWKCASREAISYMMDPRHFLNEYDIFQFQELSSSEGDESAVRAMIKGTFMDKDSFREECVKAITEAAKTYNINPYFITSKIIQEQSSAGSVLSLGEGYDVNGDGINEYVGLYNLFNIGAYQTVEAGTIENGLKYAESKGWTTMYKAIIDGAQFLKNEYIGRGQSTAYFQKYNVIDKNNLYAHQYMTNVWGAYSEGKGMRSKYIKYNIYNNQFVFTIPLYNNMPEMTGQLVYVNVNDTLKLKDAPNGNYLLSINAGSIILRTENATEKIGGYYWDKVITAYGEGYMARAASDDSKTYLVPLNLIEPEDNKQNEDEEKDEKIYNFTEPDEQGHIKTEPSVTVNELKEKYPNASIVNKEGVEISGESLIGTGDKIKIDGVEKYTIVKLGDVNGDGEVDIIDMALVKRHISGRAKLTDVYLTAGILQENVADIDIIDMALLKRHISQKQLITLN